MQLRAPDGWEWFTIPATPEGEPVSVDAASGDLAAKFARCFTETDGQAVLHHLQALTLRRVLTPSASDHELRHLEGQRQLVAYISALVTRGLRD